MKKTWMTLIIVSLVAALLSGCGDKDPVEGAWDCPIENLEWGMHADDIREFYTITSTSGTDDYSCFILEDDIELFGETGEIVLSLQQESGLDSVSFKFTEEKPGKFSDALEDRYGSRMKSDSKTKSYGGYWRSESSDDLGLYDSQVFLEAYMNHYGVINTDTSYQEFKSMNFSAQALYYVRVIENDAGEGSALFAATIAMTLDRLMN